MAGERKTTRQFVKDRDAYREKCKAEDTACWLCGMNHIDYEAPYDDYKNDDRFQLDHFYPVSTDSELQHDPTHFRPSAAGCNNERSNGSPRPPLGIPSRRWSQAVRERRRRGAWDSRPETGHRRDHTVASFTVMEM